MELLSRLSKVDPLEAKDLYLKSRDGARKQLKAALGVVTARPEDPDEVRSFNSRCPSPRTEKETERHSDSLEQLEAAVAELSTPSTITKSPSLRLIERALAFETLDAALQEPELRRESTITDISSQAERD
eukprot:jgi/Phyca11/504229/fgenesh2_kg.PHYCAscaffold_6_\